jgi:integrase
MAKTLTDLSIRNLKPGAVRREIADQGCRGLYYVLQPSNRRSWAVRYRYGGKTRKLTLDGVGTLAAARKAAADALHELALGRDPAAMKFAAKAASKRASAERAAGTVEALAAKFIERHAKRKTRESTWKQTVHIFEHIVLPAWPGRVVHDITRRDIIDLVEGVAGDRPIMANRTLAALNKFFNYLLARDEIAASPCAGVARPSEETARERKLSDDEIKTLWLACEAVGGVAGACIKILLLTGQRRSEVAGMRRSEIRGGTWELPGTRTKNKQSHSVPLSAQALAIIEAVPLVAGSDYVFTLTGKAPIGHFDQIKAKLEARMPRLAPWVIHDLRRSVASGLQRIGVELPVTEKVLNHVSGSFRGIVKVYQQHEYISEKRIALQRWADHIDRLVTGGTADVIDIHSRRA